MYRDKKERGLGIKNLEIMNVELLASSKRCRVRECFGDIGGSGERNCFA